MTGEEILNDANVVRYQNLLTLHKELEELTTKFKKQYEEYEARKAEIFKQAESL